MLMPDITTDPSSSFSHARHCSQIRTDCPDEFSLGLRILLNAKFQKEVFIKVNSLELVFHMESCHPLTR